MCRVGRHQALRLVKPERDEAWALSSPAAEITITCTSAGVIVFACLCRALLGWGFLCGLAGKESACNAGHLGSIPGLERSPGEGKGYPLQYSGLEKSMDYTVHGVANSQTRLSDFHSLTHSPRVRCLRIHAVIFPWLGTQSQAGADPVIDSILLTLSLLLQPPKLPNCCATYHE